MKKEKRETSEGIKLLNRENIKRLSEKDNCKYLRLLEADTIKQMREINKK